MTSITLEQALTPLAVELAGVQDRIEHLKLDEAALKEQIRALATTPDTYAAGGLTILVSTNRRFDQKLAAKNIPAHLVPLVTYKSAPVFDKVKVSVLAPAVYDDCFAVYETKISLR